MKSIDEIKQTAVETLKIEAESIFNLCSKINDDFAKMIKMIHNSGGRVVITGIGKSANIANKIVATLNSTGTPALFMHAADAIHGDLGNIQKEDVVICISKSGETPEIMALIPYIKNLGNKIVALTGDVNSFLAKHADFILDVTVEKEACPNNLAPTSSTTAQLAMGDALAVCLLEYRGFSSEDFAKNHPGGALGKRLFLKVDDLCKHNETPEVSPATGIRAVIVEISSKRLGATAVIEKDKIIGVITDGDLRRMLEKQTSFDNLCAKDIMTQAPKTIEKNELAVNALAIMEKNNITQLLVIDNGKYFGMIHLHDLLKEGIF